jgi:hypothetical protein
MTDTQTTALPYGIRDVKITPYADAAGTTLGTVVMDLPNAQTFSFSEAEDFDTLRGDDKVVTTHGQGSTVDWELDAGGLSLDVWAAFSGGVVTETGTTPNRVTTLRKMATTARPWFLIEGQAISDSGGDIHGIVWKCKADDSIEGDFEDAKFFITSLKGTGLPLVNDVLYDFVQNETVTAIDASALTLPA